MKRGRKSVAELAVVVQGAFGQRPQPPEELTPGQAEIWRKIVSSENAEFFKTAAQRAMLADYCRHRDAADGISQIINSFQPTWIKSEEGSKRYASLLKMRDAETRAAAGMARHLRMTNQARYMPDRADRMSKNAGPSKMPWDDA